MSKTVETSEDFVVLDSGERAVVDEVAGALRRHRDQGAATLAKLVRMAFELTLPARASRRDKLALAVARGIESRQRLAEEEGGSLSSDDAARLLGISKTSVLKRLEAGKLLAWREERLNAARFPRWQFDERGRVLDGLPEVLRVLRANPRLDDWAAVLFFMQEKSALDGARPLDRLREGRWKEVVPVAQAYAD